MISSQVVVQCCESMPSLLRSKDNTARKKEASSTTRHPNKVRVVSHVCPNIV